MGKVPVAVDAPEIELSSLDGVKYSLKNRKSKYTLVHFWAIWCAPCRTELPQLGELDRLLANEDVDIVAINLGDKEEALSSFLEKTNVKSLKILLDSESATGKNWHVQALPATFVVGPDKLISYATIGARDWADPEVLNWVKAIVSGGQLNTPK